MRIVAFKIRQSCFFKVLYQLNDLPFYEADSLHNRVKFIRWKLHILTNYTI